MKNADFEPFIGEEVEVITTHRGVMHSSKGVLLCVIRNELCLMKKNGERKYVRAPRYYFDDIRLVNE